jgi:hypothetical protein
MMILLYVAIKTLLSPLGILPKIVFFGSYTLPLKSLSFILALLGLQYNAQLLAESCIFLYQYTIIAFSIGCVIGLINLFLFYILKEIFGYFDSHLQYDTKRKRKTNSSINNLITKIPPSTNVQIKNDNKKIPNDESINNIPNDIIIKEINIKTSESNSPSLQISSSSSSLPDMDPDISTKITSIPSTTTLHHRRTRRPSTTETITDPDITMSNVPLSSSATSVDVGDKIATS